MESERESDSEKGEREEIDDGWHQHRPRTVIENWSDLTERRVKKKEEDFSNARKVLFSSSGS